MINFNEIEEVVIKNFNNGEGEIIARIYNDGLNKILIGTLKKRCSVGYHKHETSSEVIHILNGKAKCIIDDKIEYLEKGDVHYCKKGSSHSVINEFDEDLVMLCIVPNQ